MPSTTAPAAHLALLATALGLAWVVAPLAAGAEGPDAVPPDDEGLRRIRAKAAAVEQPFDDPDRAREWARARREVADPGRGDRAELLERALARVAGMPRYSTREGRFLDPGEAGDDRAALATWDELGPGNIGGRIRALSVHPDRPGTMVAGGVSGGIWTTTNGGASWRARGDFLASISIGAITRSPENPEILYAGTGEGYFREDVRGTALPLRGAGIFRSTDGGSSWGRLPGTSGSDFHWVNDLEVSTGDPARIYAATRTGVWRSLDGGGSWSRILDPGVNGGCLDLTLRSDRPGDELLASCGTFARATIHRTESAEGSPAWEAVLGEAGMGRTSLGRAPSDQETVYALAASIVPGPGGNFDGGLHAVFRSDQAGRAGTWAALVRSSDPVKLSTLLLSNPVIATLEECGFGGPNAYSNLGWYANVIAVDPTDPEVVWAGGVDLFRSDDGGRTWGPVSHWWASPPSAHADQHAVVFPPGYDGAGNQTMLVAGDGGVWSTSNARAPRSAGPGATCSTGASAVAWSSLNHDLGVTQFYQGTVYPDGSRVLGGTQDNGTLRAAVGDRNGWEKVLGGDGGYVAVDPTNPDVLYAETQFLGLRRSTDGGASWERAVSGIGEGQDDVLFIMPFTMDPSEPRRLWTGGRRLWRTDDGAVSWTQASPVLAGGGRVSAVAVDPRDPQRVLAGLDTGHLHRQDGALGAGSGTPWPSVLPRGGYVSWVAFDPSTPGVAYATYAGFGGPHVYRSGDGGATWSAIDGTGSGRLPDVPVHSIAVDPSDPGRLYLGTDVGVFVSTDGGGRWAAEITGFARAVTESLAVQRGPDGTARLYAFTHGRGAWRVRLVDATPGELRIVDPAPNALESAGEIVVAVERRGGSDGLVELAVATADGAATAGADYGAVAATLTWGDGQAGVRTIAIPVIDDLEVEGDEDLRIVLGEPTGGATLVGGPELVATIRDDDVEPGECLEGPQAICLAGGRFRVEVDWETPGGETGTASIATPRTDDSGVLWFFGPDNWEMLVKVLDGCALNDRYWVFAASTTDVGFELEVTDTVAGTVRRWSNPPGTPAEALTDTGAFATCGVGPGPGAGGATLRSHGPSARKGGAPGRGSAADPEVDGVPVRVPTTRGADCEDALCLRGDRFAVEVSWRDGAGGVGVGTAVPVASDDSGIFWFFEQENWELLVKVLDGCGLNDRFWVFAAATTDVEVRLVVTDRATGEGREYVDPAGRAFRSITDTGAFATCDSGA